MTGTHNFTFKTVAKIEAVLDELILSMSIDKKTETKVMYHINNSLFLMKTQDKYSSYSKNMSTVIQQSNQSAEGSFC